jgi:hypothetical protein
MKCVFSLLVVVGLALIKQALAQYAPPVGQSGTTAIYKDSAVFVDWASACVINRGYINIANPLAGLTTVGNNTSVVGKAGEGGVVSLGDGGSAIVSFNYPIYNGPGFDFAVFENSFDGKFLELAHVEVSSDGVNFFRFPSSSLTDTSVQVGTFGILDATKINNLAGKYLVNYGTPFDLQELDGTQGLDINHITHIKIIDVVGSINPLYASRDASGRIINDPYPTEFASGGFDLDGVGVIHSLGLGYYQPKNVYTSIYPTMLTPGQKIVVKTSKPIKEIQLVNNCGQLNNLSIINNAIPLPEHLSSGFYFMAISFENNETEFYKIVIN